MGKNRREDDRTKTMTTITREAKPHEAKTKIKKTGRQNYEKRKDA